MVSWQRTRRARPGSSYVIGKTVNTEGAAWEF
jgi:hypothetical protein